MIFHASYLAFSNCSCLLQSVNPSVPGVMVKRPAVEKGGMPVYQPAAPAAYPPLVQFAQQPYMPAATRE